MAKQKYIIQGLDAKESFLQEIKQILVNNSFSDVWILTAYLKPVAIENLSAEIKKSKAQIHFVVGINNGVTSFQALNQLVELNAELYTVDTAKVGSIFHVKELLAYGDKSALIICGSANITPGGIANNIEAGLVLELDLSDEGDHELYRQAKDAIDVLVSNYPFNITRQNKSSIKQLFDCGQVEDDDNTRPVSLRTTRSKQSALPAFPLRTVTLKREKKQKAQRIRKLTAKNAGIITFSEYEHVWQSNPLAKSNIGISDSPNTHPKNEMGFGRGKWTRSFDPKVYFKEDVFGNLQWTRNQLGDYTANAEFSFIICGIDYGKYTLSLLHKRKGMEAENQNNYLTSIRWGEAIGIIKNRSLIGRTLNLYKATDGNFFLIDIN